MNTHGIRSEELSTIKKDLIETTTKFNNIRILNEDHIGILNTFNIFTNITKALKQPHQTASQEIKKILKHSKTESIQRLQYLYKINPLLKIILDTHKEHPDTQSDELVKNTLSELLSRKTKNDISNFTRSANKTKRSLIKYIKTTVKEHQNLTTLEITLSYEPSKETQDKILELYSQKHNSQGSDNTSDQRRQSQKKHTLVCSAEEKQPKESAIPEIEILRISKSHIKKLFKKINKNEKTKPLGYIWSLTLSPCLPPKYRIIFLIPNNSIQLIEELTNEIKHKWISITNSTGICYLTPPTPNLPITNDKVEHIEMMISIFCNREKILKLNSTRSFGRALPQSRLSSR